MRGNHCAWNMYFLEKFVASHINIKKKKNRKCLIFLLIKYQITNNGTKPNGKFQQISKEFKDKQ